YRPQFTDTKEPGQLTPTEGPEQSLYRRTTAVTPGNGARKPRHQDNVSLRHLTLSSTPVTNAVALPRCQPASAPIKLKTIAPAGSFYCRRAEGQPTFLPNYRTRAR